MKTDSSRCLQRAGQCQKNAADTRHRKGNEEMNGAGGEAGVRSCRGCTHGCKAHRALACGWLARHTAKVGKWGSTSHPTPSAIERHWRSRTLVTKNTARLSWMVSISRPDANAIYEGRKSGKRGRGYVVSIHQRPHSLACYRPRPQLESPL